MKPTMKISWDNGFPIYQAQCETIKKWEYPELHEIILVKEYVKYIPRVLRSAMRDATMMVTHVSRNCIKARFWIPGNASLDFDEVKLLWKKSNPEIKNNPPKKPLSTTRNMSNPYTKWAPK